MAHSKYFVSLKNKMSHFNADLEYVDIIYKDVTNTSLSDSATELFPGSSNCKYATISNYKIGQQNRLLVVRHLKTTLYTAYIKDLYEEFTIYLKGILKEIYYNAKVTPERITGENRINLSSVEILKHVQAGDLVDVVIDSIFQSLENERSTISLIEKIHNKIGIEKNQGLIDQAIYYLEIRHKLVHTDGVADDDFKIKHPSLKYTGANRILLNYATVSAAQSAVLALVADIDRKIIQLQLVKPNNVSNG